MATALIPADRKEGVPGIWEHVGRSSMVQGKQGFMQFGRSVGSEIVSVCVGVCAVFYCIALLQSSSHLQAVDGKQYDAK